VVLAVMVHELHRRIREGAGPSPSANGKGGQRSLDGEPQDAVADHPPWTEGPSPSF